MGFSWNPTSTSTWTSTRSSLVGFRTLSVRAHWRKCVRVSPSQCPRVDAQGSCSTQDCVYGIHVYPPGCVYFLLEPLTWCWNGASVFNFVYIVRCTVHVPYIHIFVAIHLASMLNSLTAASCLLFTAFSVTTFIATSCIQNLLVQSGKAYPCVHVYTLCQ